MMRFLPRRHRPAVRAELDRADLARRGLVVVVAVLLVGGLLTTVSKGIIGGPDEIYARVANAGGSLGSGADVKMRGVIVGSVADVARAPDGSVQITVAMKAGELAHIPDDVHGRILPATVFGTSFLDLTSRRGSAAPPLHVGAIVPPDRSQHTLELQQALDDIDTLVKALRPAQLDATLSSVAAALDGRGAEIGRVIDDLDAFLRKVQPRVPLIRADLAKLATNLQLLQAAGPDLLDGVRDTLGTLRTIAARRTAIATLLTSGRSVAEEARRLLVKIEPDLVRFLDGSVVVTDIFHDLRHQAFTDSFATLRELRAKLATIVHHGFADNTILIQGTTPPYYTGSDCPRYGTARGDNCVGAAQRRTR
jgi:phospholipid/cholesterol/gamma-HCH transport system substrate-binding protein